MATPIRIKRSAVPAKPPVNNDLLFGELGLNTFDGRVFLKQDQGKLGIGTRIVEVGAGSRIGKTIFVTTSGSDTNSGLNEVDSKGSVKGAASIALPGDTIKVYPGIYIEDNPVTLARNVSVEGTELRNCIVTPKNVDRDLFYVNNSCHVTDMSFRLDDGRDMTDGAAVIAFEPLLGVSTDRFFDAARMIRYNLDYISKESVGFLTSGFSGFAGNNKEQDAARLIDSNLNFIAAEAVGFIISNDYDGGNFASLLPNPSDCEDDIVDVFSAVSNDLKANSNKKSVGAGLSYFSSEGALLHVTGIATQAATIAALNYAIGVATHVINNQSLSVTYQDDNFEIPQTFNNSITVISGGCVGVGTTISQLVGIVTNMIGSASTSSAPEIRFGVNLDSSDCADDVKDVWKAICHDITRGGNSKCVDAASKYYDSDNNLITTFLKNPGEVDQTIATLDYSFNVARAVVNNSSWGGRPVGVGTTVVSAFYDGSVGTVTILAANHGLSKGDAVRISGLGFSCSTGGPIDFPSGKYGYIFNVQSVLDSSAFDVVIGKSTIPHTYISGGKVEKYKNFQDNIVQLKDISIQSDPFTGFNNSVTGCSNVMSAMHTCVGIVTDIVRHSPSIVGTQFKKSYPGNSADGFRDTIGITSAVYNERTGNLYLESEESSFNKGDRIELRNLNFECLSGGSISTQPFPSGKLGNEFYIDTLNEDNSFIVNVGTSTLPHTYVSGGFIVDRSVGVATASYDNSTGIASIGAPGLNVTVGDTVEVKDLQFSCDPSYAGVTTTLFPSGANGYNFKVLEITGIKTSYDVNGSTYNPSTGVLQLSIQGGHNLSDGDQIKIEDNSLTFVCSDNFEKVTYPRTADPSSGRYLPVTVIGSSGFTVNVGTSTFVNYDISNAIYNPNNGNLDLTIGAHTLRKGTSVRLNQGSLTFTCAKDSNATNHAYPRPDTVAHTAQTASYNTFTGNMEVTTTSDHGMRNGDWIKLNDNSLSFSCTYGSGTHTFVSGALTASGVSFTATDAAYNPSTGVMIIDIGTHTLSAGDSIQIDNGGITFTCDADNNATQHTYPRSTDPASGVPISIIDADQSEGTITVYVGAVSNSQTKSYPRSGDPISGRWVKVFNVTNNTFSIPVLNIIPSTNNSPHTFVSAVTDGITQKKDKSYDAPIKITGVGSTTISLNVGISSNLSSHTFVSADPDALKTGGNYNHTFISAASDAVTSDNSKISVNVGTSTITHTYTSGGIVRPPYSSGVGPITQGPYIRNCTNFIPKSIGMRINGFDAEPADQEDIGVTGSMSVDSFTQFNQGGIGVSITNGAYAQLVSIFTICDEIAIYTESGGQCDLTNSNASFGTFGLVSKGVGDQTSKSIYRYTGIANTTSPIDDDVVVISGIGNERPYDGQSLYFDELYYFISGIKITNPGSGYSSPPRVTIGAPTGPQGANAEGSTNIDTSGSVTSVDIIADGSQYQSVPTVTFESPTGSGTTATGEAIIFPIYYSIESATLPSAGISTIVLNQRLNNTISVGATVYFSRVSLQITSSHSFEWVGSGNDIDFAKPGLGGVVIQENEVVEEDGGQVVYTSTDQAGNFRIGDGLVANQLTGTISGRSFDQSIINKVNPLIIALG